MYGTRCVWYTAVGCGKLDAPAGGWVRHGNDDVTLVGCDTSSGHWELRCHGNVWMTGAGDNAASINCTQGGRGVRCYSSGSRFDGRVSTVRAIVNERSRDPAN